MEERMPTFGEVREVYTKKQLKIAVWEDIIKEIELCLPTDAGPADKVVPAPEELGGEVPAEVIADVGADIEKSIADLKEELKRMDESLQIVESSKKQHKKGSK